MNRTSPGIAPRFEWSNEGSKSAGRSVGRELPTPVPVNFTLLLRKLRALFVLDFTLLAERTALFASHPFNAPLSHPLFRYIKENTSRYPYISSDYKNLGWARSAAHLVHVLTEFFGQQDILSVLDLRFER